MGHSGALQVSHATSLIVVKPLTEMPAVSTPSLVVVGKGCETWNSIYISKSWFRKCDSEGKTCNCLITIYFFLQESNWFSVPSTCIFHHYDNVASLKWQKGNLTGASVRYCLRLISKGLSSQCSTMIGPSTHNTIVSFSYRKATGSVIPRARGREIVVILNKLQKLSLWFFRKNRNAFCQDPFYLFE